MTRCTTIRRRVPPIDSSDTSTSRWPRGLPRGRTSAITILVITTTVLLLHTHYVNIVISSIKCQNSEGDSSESKLPVNPEEEIVRHDPSEKLKIIELSYMRSGSTFCGDILQAHPDVFYVYEPLLYLWDHYMPEREGRYNSLWERTKAHWQTTKKSYIPKPLDFLTYMFNCNLTAYTIEFLTNIAHSQDFNGKGCVTRKSAMHAVVKPNPKCVNGVRQNCQKAKAVVQKLVRLTMEEADDYLELDPSVRVIHLLRDPRGILLSRMHFNNKTGGEMHKNYTYICRRLWDDLSVSKRIAEKHWGKILTVRYEDLAQDPLFIVATMYKFAGLELLPTIRDYLHQMTSSDTLKDTRGVKAQKTSRKNPLATAYNWRIELPFDLVQKIDRDCVDVMKELGYVTFSSESQLRDMGLPAKHETYGAGLMTAWNMP